MRLARNVLTGIASSIWSAALAFAAIPIYLRYIGVDAYGLIGFFTTTQAVIQLLDLGIAPAVNREVARTVGTEGVRDAKELITTFATVYWVAGIVIAAVLALSSSMLSSHWIHSEHLSRHTVQQAVILMGIVIGFRWPVGLYAAVINGAQRLAVTSAITMVVSTFATVGAVLVLAFVSRSIQAFFVWQAAAAVLNVSLMQMFAWRIMGREAGIHFKLQLFRRIWRFSVGMSAINVLGVVFMQMDKVLLSKLLSLTAFGEYMIAATVAGSLSLLTTPVFNALFPRFAALVASQETDSLRLSYRTAMRGFSSVIFCVALVLATLAAAVVRIWTRNPTIAAAVAPIVSLLAVGSALNGAMTVPHALQLAYGLTRLPLLINSVLLVLMGPAIIALVYLYGGLGGALAWLLLNVLYTILSLWLTQRAILRDVSASAGIADVCIPFAWALLAAGVTYAFRDIGLPLALQVLLGAVVGLLTMVASISAFPASRAAMFRMIGRQLPHAR